MVHAVGPSVVQRSGRLRVVLRAFAYPLVHSVACAGERWELSMAIVVRGRIDTIDEKCYTCKSGIVVDMTVTEGECVEVGKGVLLEVEGVLQDMSGDLACAVMFDGIFTILATKEAYIARCRPVLPPPVRAPSVPNGTEGGRADPRGHEFLQGLEMM